MLSALRRLSCLTLVPVALATACSSAEPEETSSADAINYRSTAGQEFELQAELRFTLPPNIQSMEGATRETATASHIESVRRKALTAINAELDRLWPEAERLKFAGVAIMLRQSTPKESQLREVDDGGRYAFTLTAEFGAIKDLEQRLPLRIIEGKKVLPVPADLGDGAEELLVTVRPIERSRNAYPKYLELFEDGLDIGVHVGGDHNDPPKDIDHARSIYDDLIASGFKSPVAKFEDLKIDSAPLRKTIQVKGKAQEIRVHIVHVDMTTPETRTQLIDAFKSSVKTADVVIYDGHAGTQLDYSGIAVAYKPARVALKATDFKTIEASDKQQVYLFNGCETYTGYADELYKNPKRNTANTDVITTVNFSAIQAEANQVITFIHSFVDEQTGTFVPQTWDTVLERMNKTGERSWVHVYGVHGLDENPTISPLADVRKVGTVCTKDADCGAADSKCLTLSSTRKVCGAACADSAGCPSGTKCELVSGAAQATSRQCTPQQ
jgi:hypothetical protein